MASRYTAPLLGASKSLISWSNRFVKFLKHRMLTQRKNILIIGDEDSSVYMKLYPQLVKAWEIIHIAQSQPLMQQLTNSSQPQEYVQSQTKAKLEEKQISIKVGDNFFKRLYLNNENYEQIQKQLLGKQFDSIIVLPKQDKKAPHFEIDDQNFVIDYPNVHQQLLMKNLFAYRLANKYLTSSGVIILSISQRDFTKQYEDKNQKDEDNLLRENKEMCAKKYCFSNELIDAQINYLGVVIGDRDYTDLNSWSIIALSKEIGEENSDFVAKYYKIWADSQQLPMPGTFALFKRKTVDSKTHYVEYL